MRSHFLILVLASAVLTLPAAAHDARLGPIHVLHPMAPATLPGQTSAVVYLAIENEGAGADRLMSATSPAAGGAGIHSMAMEGNIMKMRELDTLPLPPATTVSLKADSGRHLMLTGLKQPLNAGDSIPMELTFEHAGKLAVSVHVGRNAAQKASGPGAPAATHAH